MQKEAYIESWRALFKNLICAVPDIAYGALSLIALLIFGYTSGVAQFVMQSYTLENFLELLVRFFSENLLKVIVSLVGFIIVTFFVGVGRDAVKYDLMRDVSNNKKADIKKAWNEKKKFYMNVVGLKVKIFLIYLALAIFFGMVMGLLAIDENGEYTTWVLISSMIALTLAMITIHVILMFRYAIMFNKNYNSSTTIKESFRLFKKKYKTFFIVFILVNLSLLLGSSAMLIVNRIPFFGWMAYQLGIIMFAVWADLYIFYSYKST